MITHNLEREVTKWLVQYQKPAILMGHQQVSVAHSTRLKIQLRCVH